MDEKLEKVGVAWYHRKETLKECTEAFLIFLERLKLFDPRLGIWYEQGSSKNDALKNKVKLEYDYIRNKFCKKCNDTDYPDISFRLGIWNGNTSEGESIGLSTSLGNSYPGINNSNCLLSMPYKGEIYEHYCVSENYHQLQNLFIDHWDPQFIYKNGKWVDL